MPVNTIYTLGESQISISGGGQLSGITQGDGTHLAGRTITLNSNDWEAIDVFDSAGDTNFADSDSSQTLSGAQTMDGTAYANGARVEAEYELTLRDPDGNTYTVLGFNINEGGGASYATVEGLAFVGGVGGFPPRDVPLTVISTAEGPSHAYSSLATPPCFTAQTRIRTRGGEVPITQLVPGDLVMTADNGAQPIRWIGRTYLPAAVLARRPEFRPVRIARDAFGADRPSRDSVLSPQHRILIRDWRAAYLFGEDEVLVPIKKMINDSSITIDHGAQDVTYYHLAFDRHELIWGDGLLSESYLMSDYDAPETHAELVALFPDMPGAAGMRTARVCVGDRRSALLRPDSSNPAPICPGTGPAAFP
ncbi:MAG TPA: Hint domain-containing protein [Roseovarius sp.]